MRSRNKTLISCSIGKQKALWLPGCNKYVLAAPPADLMAEMIADGKNRQEIIKLFVSTVGCSPEEAGELESQMRKAIELKHENQAPRAEEQSLNLFRDQETKKAFSERFYKFFDLIFRISYTDADVEYMIHPKFSHLETAKSPESISDHIFRAERREGYLAFQADGKWFGAWPEEYEEFFCGSFSSSLLEKAYIKDYGGWMALLHASAIGINDKCLILTGSSGSGKSTAAALLIANGFELFADDILPLESGSGLVCYFPAAISLKQKAMNLLLPLFPDLHDAEIMHYPKKGKSVRYLPFQSEKNIKRRKACCRDLIFMNYQPDSGYQLDKMEAGEAFAQLIPDTWIHPSSRNAKLFLEWFKRLDCYRLTYSDNEKMKMGMERLLGSI